jgi:pyroglutamyl-peptidase
MTILVTGYEPFGDHDRNPSGALARDVDGDRVAGHDVVGRVLPVEFDAVGDELAALVDAHDPAVLLSTGLAAGRAALSVERVGVNVADAVTTPDNADEQPHETPIDPDGPTAYFSTLPVGPAVDAMLDAGVPARLSNTAGTHCCNNALYRGRALMDERGRETPVGFVHLPCTPAGAAAKGRDGEARHGESVPPSLPLSLQREGVLAALAATLGGD